MQRNGVLNLWLNVRGAISIALVVAASLLMIHTDSSAKPVNIAQAQKIVKGWLALDPDPLAASLSKQISHVRSFTNEKGELIYYVIELHPSGFVVVSADDLIEPIVAFTSTGRYDPSPESPLGALVSRDMAGRIDEAKVFQRSQKNRL